MHTNLERYVCTRERPRQRRGKSTRSAGRRLGPAAVALAAVLSTGSNCGGLVQALSFLDFNQRLAERWAPVHHQDVDQTGSGGLGGRSDFLSAVDFDGDWDTLDNWESAPNFPLRGTAYYSVVATSTHWFIVYAFYHPRDWSDTPIFGGLDEHENDMEGLLAIVRRPAVFATDDFGTLVGMVTVFHLDFFSYTPVGSPLTDGAEDIDGTVNTTIFGGGPRPVTAQEAKGHGLKAHPQVQIQGGDGLIYFPTGTAEVPSGPNDRFVGYELVNIFHPGGLWERRDNSETFASFGTFRGDNGKNNAAHAPWGWDDHDDGGALTGGEMALDPAKLVQIYFNGLGSFSTTYTYNGYQGITCSWPQGC